MPTVTPTEQQLSAIKMVADNQISMLIGGPGTGKTFTLSLVLEWAKSKKISYRLCAPTGKAAKRMIESTGENSQTIHSLLGCTFSNGNFKFIHDEVNKLKVELLIIDEFSMVSLSLFHDLLKAIDYKKTKLLIIGDDGQLPSVGPGAILRDLIDCDKVSYAKLDIIHRNSGKIVENCKKIRSGEIYTIDKKLDLDIDNPVNHIHFQVSTPEKILDGIEKLIIDVIPKKYKIDPVWDIQTISPVNIRGKLSCDSINRRLQKKLNPKFEKPKDDDGPLIFFEGDKIIQTKNENDVLCAEKRNQRTWIVNGDMGIIESIDSKNYTINFLDPPRKVLIPKFKHNLLHAYAITCHRFQGSECKVIIIPVHTSFSFFCTRKWLYTAVSRAQVICITIGQFAAIERMIKNQREIDRITMLKEFISEYIKYEIDI